MVRAEFCTVRVTSEMRPSGTPRNDADMLDLDGVRCWLQSVWPCVRRWSVCWTWSWAS